MNENHEEKLKDIESVYHLWSGLYISGENAMSQIADIFRTEYRTVENARFVNSEGNIIHTSETATIKFKKTR